MAFLFGGLEFGNENVLVDLDFLLSLLHRHL
jgi:hypothetical protein